MASAVLLRTRFLLHVLATRCQRLWKKKFLLFCEPLPWNPAGKNCSPGSDLVLRRPTFPRVFFSWEVIFFTDAGISANQTVPNLANSPPEDGRLRCLLGRVRPACLGSRTGARGRPPSAAPRRAMDQIILYYIILYHITLHYITLHYIVLYHIIVYYHMWTIAWLCWCVRVLVLQGTESAIDRAMIQHSLLDTLQRGGAVGGGCSGWG